MLEFVLALIGVIIVGGAMGCGLDWLCSRDSKERELVKAEARRRAGQRLLEEAEAKLARWDKKEGEQGDYDSEGFGDDESLDNKN